MEYQYTINPESDTPIMLINKHIGTSNNGDIGVVGSQFQKELYTLDQTERKEIKIYINSIGGNVIEGYSIYSAILNTKNKVNTYCMGICASISAVIFQAGRKRYMSDYGVLMVHNPYNPNEYTETEATQNMKVSIATMLATRSGVAYEKMLEYMQYETWFTVANTPNCGMWDEIIHSDTKNKPPRKLETVEDTYNYFANTLNSLLLTKPSKNMDTMNVTEICNLLDINDPSKIANTINSLKATKTENEALKEQLQKVENEKNKVATDMQNSLALLEKYENKLKEIEENAELLVIENALKEFTQVNDTNKAFWIANMKRDLDGTLNVLKASEPQKPANPVTSMPSVQDVINNLQVPQNTEQTLENYNQFLASRTKRK